METSAIARRAIGGDLRKSVWALAIPAVVEQLLQMLVGVADMAMVGKLGPAAIASVDVSNRIVFFVVSIFAAISVGATAVVAREIGAGRDQDANEAARQSLVVVALLAVGLGVLGYLFSSQVSRFMLIFNADPDPAVLANSTTYLKIVTWSMPLGLTMIVVNAILRGAGDTRTPMYVTGLANIINIIGNYFLIFGIGPFPEMGVAGAATATALARFIGGILVIIVLYSGRFKLRLSLTDDYRLRWNVLRRVFLVGVPAAGEQLIFRGGQLIFGMIVAGLDTVSIAAHAITMTAESLSFMPGFGFALAATTLVGQNLGAEDPERAEESGNLSASTATWLMSAMGVLFFIFPSQLVGLFTSDPEVVPLASLCLRIVAVSQPFLAQVMVLAGALRGAGDTKFVMYMTGITIWLIRVVFAYVLAIVFNLGLVGAWIAMVIDLMVRGILARWRYSTGSWKLIKV